MFIVLLKAGHHVVSQEDTLTSGTVKLLDAAALPRLSRNRNDDGRPDRRLRWFRRRDPSEHPPALRRSAGLSDAGPHGISPRLPRAGRSRGTRTRRSVKELAIPHNQRPIELGIDLVVHSATKYLSGHSDATAGAVVGARDALHRLWEALIVYGMTLHPMENSAALPGASDVSASDGAAQPKRRRSRALPRRPREGRARPLPGPPLPTRSTPWQRVR